MGLVDLFSGLVDLLLARRLGICVMGGIAAAVAALYFVPMQRFAVGLAAASLVVAVLVGILLELPSTRKAR
jgi:hypothetical protein